MSDSITSISGGSVVQQVLRLAVRLADCRTTCCEYVVDLLCDKLSNLLYDLLFVLQLAVDLLCDKLSNLLYDLLFALQLVVGFCRGLAVGFRFVVDLS